MGKVNPWKMGIGAGSMLLGVYFVFNFQQDISSVIFGIVAVAFGIGLIASN